MEEGDTQQEIMYTEMALKNLCKYIYLAVYVDQCTYAVSLCRRRLQ